MGLPRRTDGAGNFLRPLWHPKRFSSVLRWVSLLVASALFTLGLLNLMKAPPWSSWKLAVVAGEYGHWFAIGAVGLAGLAWLSRGEQMAMGSVTVGLAMAATVLLSKPAFQAWRVSLDLPLMLSASPETDAVTSEPFSLVALFGGGDRQLEVAVQRLITPENLPLDFYVPGNHAGGRGRPCVIVVHGGGWNSGDRGQIPHFNHWLASRGYAVAAISYRLAPHHVWPAQREDLQAAVVFLQLRAAELGIDPTRLVVLGRSAGGQIALATAYAARDPAIRGVIALYAPSDLIFGYVNTHENDMLKSPALMRQFLGGTPEAARASYESASALFHVSPRTPPTLLLHGENDALVWHRHSIRLAAKLAENNVPHAFVTLPWATHAFDYNLNGPGGQVTRYAIERFLAGVTR